MVKRMEEKIEYVNLESWLISCYVYHEDDEHEHYWVDYQNAIYHTINDMDEETGLIDGKKWWIIGPLKPKGTKLTMDNMNILKWVVFDCYNGEDEDKQWDFKKHRPVEE